MILRFTITPSKANVVVDVVSHKARCNYRPVVSISGKEPSVRITPIMAQYNVTLTPMLEGRSLQLKAAVRESHTLRGGWLKVTLRSTAFAWMRKELSSSRIF
jgi:hypothetical protein